MPEQWSNPVLDLDKLFLGKNGQHFLKKSENLNFIRWRKLIFGVQKMFSIFPKKTCTSQKGIGV